MPLRLFPSRRHRSTIASLTALVVTLALGACQTSDLALQAPVKSPPVLALAATGGSIPPVFGEVLERAPAAIVIDEATGATIYADDADGLRYPASLSKLMSLYLVFEQLQSGRLKLDDDLLVSPTAAAKPAVKLGLAPGSTIKVRDAIQAMAVKSTNDVASVVAENLAGSEEAFARAMTAKARALGMKHSYFVNPSGLPDPRQISTAHDMAILARALRLRFPAYVRLFSEGSFDYAGHHYVSTNKLLGKVPGVDGMKTGYIRASGFHLVVSASRGGRRVIVVVMGGKTGRARDERAALLVDQYL